MHDFQPDGEGKCTTCGFTKVAHSELPEHPNEEKARAMLNQKAVELRTWATRALLTVEKGNRVQATVDLRLLEDLSQSLRDELVRLVSEQIALKNGQNSRPDTPDT